DDMLRTDDAAAEVFFRLPGYCGAPPTVWMACGAAPDTFGAVPPASLVIRRPDTGCQRSASSAASTWDWISPQPVVGSRGMSFSPFAPMSTTCGGISARAGQTVPWWRVAGGGRRGRGQAARAEAGPR